MSKGRVTLLVVEGPTDQTFLAEPLQQLFALASQSVRFAVLGNDVTSDERLSDKSFISRIWSSIASTLSQLGLCKSDLSRIIQITDLDGAFIPDSNIVGGWKGNELFYTDNCIHAKDAQEIRRRNARKRRRIDTLLQINSLSGIPYLLCYMSQNIEHVLVDERNCFYKTRSSWQRKEGPSGGKTSAPSRASCKNTMIPAKLGRNHGPTCERGCTHWNAEQTWLGVFPTVGWTAAIRLL